MLRRLILAGLFALAPVAGHTDALDEITERGTVRLGVRADAPPFSHLDAEGQPTGLAVALCLRVVRALQQRLELDELTVDYVQVDSRSRFDRLTSRAVDLHCGPMTATLARREIVDFSIPYFMDGVSAALRADGVEDLAQLSGQPIGVLAGTTAVDLAKGYGEVAGSALIEFTSHSDGLMALGDGLIEAYFADQGLLLYQMGRFESTGGSAAIKVLDDQFSYEPYAIAMPLGEHRLRIEVDRALSATFRSDEIFDEIEAAMGPFEMSGLTALIYALVALPE